MAINPLIYPKILLSENEIDTILAKRISLKHKSLIILHWFCGLSFAEIANLLLTDIHSKEMVITPSRINTLVKYPIKPKYIELLREFYRENRTKAYLFEKEEKPFSYRKILKLHNSIVLRHKISLPYFCLFDNALKTRNFTDNKRKILLFNLREFFSFYNKNFTKILSNRAIAVYLDFLKYEKNKDKNTIIAAYLSIYLFYSLLFNHKVQVKAPWKQTIQPVPSTIFSTDEIANLTKNIEDEKVRTFCLFVYYTGIQPEVLCRLKIDNIDLKAKKMMLHSGINHSISFTTFLLLSNFISHTKPKQYLFEDEYSEYIPTNYFQSVYQQSIEQLFPDKSSDIDVLTRLQKVHLSEIGVDMQYINELTKQFEVNEELQNKTSDIFLKMFTMLLSNKNSMLNKLQMKMLVI